MASAAECDVADIALLVDRSGSICDNQVVTTCDNWDTILRFIVNIVDNLDVRLSRTRVALIVFGSHAELQFGLTA